MKTYEFTLSFTMHVYKIVISAFNIQDAYYDAFFEFAQHILRWNLTPEKIEISYREMKEGE